jgi:hypothetical protein
MRRLTVLLLLCLALPAAAFAARGAPGDGSLVVSNAEGVLTVEVKGVIFGHFDRGKMTVLEWKADDNELPTVSGAKMDVKGAKAHVVYTGADVRFLFPSGKYKLKFEGLGIDLSAVGAGKLVATKNSLDEGTMAVNGAKATPLAAVVVFGGNLPSVTADKLTSASDKSSDKSGGSSGGSNSGR